MYRMVFSRFVCLGRVFYKFLGIFVCLWEYGFVGFVICVCLFIFVGEVGWFGMERRKVWKFLGCIVFIGDMCSVYKYSCVGK